MKALSYIILAHKNPIQLRRLVNKLNWKNTYFYIHIDKNTNGEKFKEGLSTLSNIYFIPDNERIRCLWGDFSIVEAMIKCLERIVKDGRDGYTIFLSGQDYPLKSNKYIYNFFLNNLYDYMAYSKFPIENWGEKGGFDKIDRYWFSLSNYGKKKVEITPYSLRKRNLIDFARIILYDRSLLSKVLKFFFIKREYPKYLDYYGGEAWWALRNSSVRKIYNYFIEHPDFIDFNIYTLSPDEMLCQSILCSDNEIYPDIKNTTLRFINWKDNLQSPLTIVESDFQLIKDKIYNDAECLFARKFDISIDNKIMDLIDSELNIL